VSKKSISFAPASVFFDCADSDQYMEALLTIFGDSPFACAGTRSSFISVPLAVPKAEIWVWNRKWKAALFVANSDWSSAAVAFSACLAAEGVAFMSVSFMA
jgi:hypothetical protein